MRDSTGHITEYKNMRIFWQGNKYGVAFQHLGEFCTECVLACVCLHPSIFWLFNNSTHPLSFFLSHTHTFPPVLVDTLMSTIWSKTGWVSHNENRPNNYSISIKATWKTHTHRTHVLYQIIKHFFTHITTKIKICASHFCRLFLHESAR